jgi:IBR domain, a half RING-finger domain
VQATETTDNPLTTNNENAAASDEGVFHETTTDAGPILQPPASDPDQAQEIPAEMIDTAMADDHGGDLEDIAGPADDGQDDSDDDDGQDEDGNEKGDGPNIPGTDQFIWIANRADAVDETTSCKLCMTDPDPMEALYVECGHMWCKDCLNQYFAQVFTDREQFPPRCCRPEGFSLENVQMHLDDEVLIHVMEKWEEWSASDPTYCANIQCRSFISNDQVNGQKAVCIKCKVVTCVECKAKMCLHHAPDMHPYPIDDPENDKLAEKEGWKRCPNKKCNKLVEKIEGCDTMTCRCGQQFCYGCGNSFEGPFPCTCNGQNAWVGQVQAWANGVDGNDDDGDNQDDEDSEDDSEDYEEDEEDAEDGDETADENDDHDAHDE